MIRFLESSLGQLIARNGILAVILAWSMWSNHGLVERLFLIIENNTKALNKLDGCLDGRPGKVVERGDW